MVGLNTTGRKDDLESLMYVLCFLKNGSIPIVSYVNKQLSATEKKSILEHILLYRRANMDTIRLQILEMMSPGMRSALTYIFQLDFKDKPNYNLIKFFLSTTE
jgi:hypothetical protein